MFFFYSGDERAIKTYKRLKELQRFGESGLAHERLDQPILEYRDQPILSGLLFDITRAGLVEDHRME